LPNFFNPVRFNDLIRLGRNNDGGYIIREIDVLETEILISLGVNFDWSFEKDFLTYNKKIFLQTFDGSSGLRYFRKSLKTRIKIFLSNPNIVNFQKILQRLKLTLSFIFFFKLNLTKKINHTEKFVGEYQENFSDFFQFYGYDPQFISFEDIFNESTKNVFLSIDIEGGEYKLLKDLVKYSDFIIGLNIEFHNIIDHLDEIESFIKDINLHLIHTHINNFGSLEKGLPKVIELSFSKIRNNNENSRNELVNLLPIDLDQPNDKYGVDYEVQFKY